MSDINARLAKGMGEHYAAAMYDHANADPADVSWNGVPVKGWREGYAEGCKDMAETVTRLLALETANLEAFKTTIFESYKAERDRLEKD